MLQLFCPTWLQTGRFSFLFFPHHFHRLWMLLCEMASFTFYVWFFFEFLYLPHFLFSALIFFSVFCPCSDTTSCIFGFALTPPLANRLVTRFYRWLTRWNKPIVEAIPETGHNWYLEKWVCQVFFFGAVLKTFSSARRTHAAPDGLTGFPAKLGYIVMTVPYFCFQFSRPSFFSPVLLVPRVFWFFSARPIHLFEVIAPCFLSHCEVTWSDISLSLARSIPGQPTLNVGRILT